MIHTGPRYHKIPWLLVKLKRPPYIVAHAITREWYAVLRMHDPHMTDELGAPKRLTVNHLCVKHGVFLWNPISVSSDHGISVTSLTRHEVLERLHVRGWDRISDFGFHQVLIVDGVDVKIFNVPRKHGS